MSEENSGKLPYILGFILIFCLYGWLSERSSYNSLKKEYLDYQDFVHSTVEHAPYLLKQIIDYEMHIEDVKSAMSEYYDNKRY